MSTKFYHERLQHILYKKGVWTKTSYIHNKNNKCVLFVYCGFFGDFSKEIQLNLVSEENVYKTADRVIDALKMDDALK